MPNKCTKCGEVYEDGSDVILKGCKCGNRFFFYFRKLSDAEAMELKTSKRAKEIESLKGIVDIEGGEPKVSRGTDIWNIRVKGGVYEIDVASLMMKEPIIVAGDEGRYLVSLTSAFEEAKRKSIKR